MVRLRRVDKKTSRPSSKVAAAATVSSGKKKEQEPRLSGGERSAYFARREAAKVLRQVLQGDARRRAVASIKSLIYKPSVRNKRGTFALVCQTLKYLSVIKDVLEGASIWNSRWKRQEELIYIVAYDILFGEAVSLVGDAEKLLVRHKNSLQTALERTMKRKKVKTVDELVASYMISDVPRYVRVNTLKLDIDSAIHALKKRYKVQKDDLLPDLLILPPGTDLHDHPLIKNGSIFMQGKASSMVATALDPHPGWEVLDACAAPGNKTVHLAALLKKKGRVVACELKKERIKRLNETIEFSGSSNIKVIQGDFLELKPKDPSFSKVQGILLDPSCSGSGTASSRLDHLLPSHKADQDTDTERLNKLAAFQRKALTHALCFPAVERVVYSTCSIHQIENEDVINSVLPIATSHGFQLATPFPQWPRRGLPVFEGSEHLLRTDPEIDGEGFFIALFVRKGTSDSDISEQPNRAKAAHCGTQFPMKIVRDRRRTRVVPFAPAKMYRMWSLLMWGNHGNRKTTRG